MKFAQTAVRAALLSTISIGSMSLSSVAFAQDESAVAEEEAVADEDVIVVTATKREQTLEEVPVAVSVTSGAEIERAQIRDLNDLQTLVPSLRVGQLQSSANTNFIIRGFGNGANNVGIEPSVGVFIDGVYRSRSAPKLVICPICSASKCFVAPNRRCSARTLRPALSRLLPRPHSSSSAARLSSATVISTRLSPRPM